MTTAVLVRYFAGAQAAAGVPEERVEVPPTTTVAQLLADRAAAHGDALARVLPRCSVLVDGVVRRDLGSPVGDAAGLDVLPPFAGG
ncbi:MoaD/ThiS family protein [Cellulomonas endophytica]|uniref:MoaD/ThiS family protein n=1 Tax=Cellulomonas endophytica TaxID=2494735 RepID=UPI0010131974|nr:MoaD/ThiS family protein [Cellulomonas endophytica]